jgi:hypothetical protein
MILFEFFRSTLSEFGKLTLKKNENLDIPGQKEKCALM